MFNQCIFVGKTKEIQTTSDFGMMVKLEVESVMNAIPSIVKIFIPKERLKKERHNIDQIIMVKSKAVSSNGDQCIFHAQKISFIEDTI